MTSIVKRSDGSRPKRKAKGRGYAKPKQAKGKPTVKRCSCETETFPVVWVAGGPGRKVDYCPRCDHPSFTVPESFHPRKRAQGVKTRRKGT